MTTPFANWADLPFAEIWVEDSEYYPGPGLANGGREGDPITPLCLVATELRSGRTVGLWQSEARAARSGLERDAAAADAACAELAADIGKAQGDADAATAAVSVAVKAVMSIHARRIADEIVATERLAGELYRALQPLAEAWFPGAPGSAGSAISLDTATRKVFANPPRLAGSDNVPPALKAANAADAVAKWRNYFDALSLDADAAFVTEI